MTLSVRINPEHGDVIRRLSSDNDISCSKITNELLNILFKDIDTSKIQIEKTGLKITLEKK